MSKVTPQIQNGDSGTLARTTWNTALKDVAFTDFESGVVIDDDTGATVTDTTLWTSESIKKYVDDTITTLPFGKSYSWVSRAGSSGINYAGGYYQASATDANLTQASLTVNYGSANSSYAAHVLVIAGGAGATDGSDLVLTVSGTSITDAGVRTGADSEVVVADCTAASTDQYFETAKKFIGTVVITLSSTGGATFNFDFNYGLAKYEDLNNRDFQLNGIEVVGLANANDSGFDIQVLAHDGTGWTYNATAFVPGGTVIASQATDHGAEKDIDSGEYFAYKRTNLNWLVDGTASEGIVVKIVTSTNGAIADMDIHLSGLLTSTLIT